MKTLLLTELQQLFCCNIRRRCGLEYPPIAEEYYAPSLEVHGLLLEKPPLELPVAIVQNKQKIIHHKLFGIKNSKNSHLLVLDVLRHQAQATPAPQQQSHHRIGKFAAEDLHTPAPQQKAVHYYYRGGS